MATKRRGASASTPTFRDMVAEVRREVTETAIETAAREQPGIFHSDACGVEVLAHPDGTVLEHVESGLTVEEARDYIRGGAEVFLTQHDCSCCGTWRWYGNAELRGHVREEPRLLTDWYDPTFDLYRGGAHHVVHILGDLAWGPIRPDRTLDGTPVD